MKCNAYAALMGLSILASPTVNAEGLSYTYAELRGVYTQADLLGPSDLTLNANGFGAAGSIAFGQTGLFATASYDSVDNDIIDGAQIDLDRTTLGLGYAVAIDETLHALIEAKGLRIKAGALGESESENGYQATVGLRSLLSETFEASIKAGVVKVDNAELEVYNGAIVEIGARYLIDGAWSIGLDTAFTKDERNAMLGLRFQW